MMRIISLLSVLLVFLCSHVEGEASCSTQTAGVACEDTALAELEEDDEQVALQVAMQASPGIPSHTQEDPKSDEQTVFPKAYPVSLPPQREEEALLELAKEESATRAQLASAQLTVPERWSDFTSGFGSQFHQALANAALSKLPVKGVVPSKPLPSSIGQFGRVLAMAVGVVLVILLFMVTCLPSRLPRPTLSLRADVESLKDTKTIYFLIMSVQALTWFQTDQYLPSLAQIQADFGTTSQIVSSTLQINWLVKAFSALFASALADRYGRRPIFMLCAILSCIGGITCACAPSVSYFMAGRVFQGMSEGAETIVMMLVRDMIEDMAERQTWLIQIMGVLVLVPTLAPVFGGVIGHLVGWRVPFIAVAGWGLLNAFAIFTFLPETIVVAADERGPYLSELKRVVTDRHLVGLSAMMFGVSLMIFSCDTNMSLILAHVFHKNQMEISWMLGVLLLSCIPGFVIPEILSESVQIVTILRYATMLLMGPLVFMLLVGIYFQNSWPLLVVSVALIYASATSCVSIVNSLYFQPVKDVSGAASGILSCGTMLVSAIGTFIGKQVIHDSGNQVGGFTKWIVGVLCVTVAIFWYCFAWDPPDWAWQDLEAKKEAGLATASTTGEAKSMEGSAGKLLNQGSPRPNTGAPSLQACCPTGG